MTTNDTKVLYWPGIITTVVVIGIDLFIMNKIRQMPISLEFIMLGVSIWAFIMFYHIHNAQFLEDEDE